MRDVVQEGFQPERNPAFETSFADAINVFNHHVDIMTAHCAPSARHRECARKRESHNLHNHFLNNLIGSILEATGERPVFCLENTVRRDSFRGIDTLNQILADDLSEAGIVDEHIADFLHDSMFGTARIESVMLDLACSRNEVVIKRDEIHQFATGDHRIEQIPDFCRFAKREPLFQLCDIRHILIIKMFRGSGGLVHVVGVFGAVVHVRVLRVEVAVVVCRVL